MSGGPHLGGQGGRGLERHGVPPGTDTRSAPGMRRAISAAIAPYLVSAAPVTSTTGSSRPASSWRRSHSGGWAPWPRARSWCARRPGAMDRRSARPGASAGTDANMGWASHPSRNRSTPPSSTARQGVVGAAPGGPLGRVGDARGGAHHHEPVDDPTVRERHLQREAPSHRVPDPQAASRARGGAGRGLEIEALGDLDGLDVERLLPIRRAVIEGGHHRGPRPGRLREAGHQDHSHATIFA